jgi:hypothetical protein
MFWNNCFLASSMALLIFSGATTAAFAGSADVISVAVERSSKGTYNFRTTVSHNDEGWDHFADQWEVLTLDGKLLGTRVLLHPHVGEQPFTRDLPGVVIPAGIKRVIVRARDSVHAYGGKSIEVTLPR